MPDDDKPFSEEQKQYLAGFTFGADVARAVSGLPVLSGSVGKESESIVSIGAGGVQVDGQSLSVGPERIALQAQADTTAVGKKLCNEEKAKQDKNPLDMWDELQARADAGEFPKGTDVFLTKFHGMFYVAPAQEAYMCRMRIPGGLIQAWQFAGVADLADKCAGGYVDVTTRANLQLREIGPSNTMNVLYGLRELDIVNLGSGGDNIRNCTASPLSGIDPNELIETIPLAKQMHHFILNHREMYGLPRKFNIAFDGGGTITALDDTNDIGFHAVSITEDKATQDLPAGVYFQLTLGGITGHKDFARDTGVLLKPSECVEVAGGIVRVFVKNGDRTDRKKARLKYVLGDWGFEKFIAAIEEELGRSLRKIDTSLVTIATNENRQAHIGVHPQSQEGRSYIGVVLPVGRMTSDQVRGLSEIATTYGNGEIRLTVWQNLLIPHVRDSEVDAVKEKIEALGLGHQASSFRAGLVACTGNAGCKFAAGDTKRHAMVIAEALESQYQLDQPINIHLTGCHHSCAQHYIGDIGLQACSVEQGDDMVEGYHVCLGGGWGANQGIGRQLFPSIPFEDVPSLICAIVGNYLERRDGDETFVSFVARQSDEELTSISTVAS